MNYQKSFPTTCVVGVLTLSGCAGGEVVSAGASSSITQTGSSSSPTSTASKSTTPPASVATQAENPNATGCQAFEAANNQLADYLTGGKQSLTVPQWKAAQAVAVSDMDMAGLRTTGAVKERIAALVSIVPAEPIEMALSTGRALAEKYNISLDRIANACSVDGAIISLTKLVPAPKF